MGEPGEPGNPLEQALLCPHHFWAQTQLCSCITQLVSLAGMAERVTTAGLTRRGTEEGEDSGEEGRREETPGLLICFRTT